MTLQLRQHERYGVRKDTFAILGSSYTKIGKIQNISFGGLLFEYLNSDLEKNDTSNGKCEIMLSENGFRMKDIPCKIAWETDAEWEILNDFDLIHSFKKCGIEFKGLNENQKEKLDYFINNHSNKNRNVMDNVTR